MTAGRVTASRVSGEAIPLAQPVLGAEEEERVLEVLRSGRLSLGPALGQFEEAFAAQLGARHAIALSSCTAALHLAYLAAGVGPGDEVIVPSFTFTTVTFFSSLPPICL